MWCRGRYWLLSVGWGLTSTTGGSNPPAHRSSIISSLTARSIHVRKFYGQYIDQHLCTTTGTVTLDPGISLRYRCTPGASPNWNSPDISKRKCNYCRTICYPRKLVLRDVQSIIHGQQPAAGNTQLPATASHKLTGSGSICDRPSGHKNKGRQVAIRGWSNDQAGPASWELTRRQSRPPDKRTTVGYDQADGGQSTQHHPTSRNVTGHRNITREDEKPGGEKPGIWRKDSPPGRHRGRFSSQDCKGGRQDKRTRTEH